LSLTQELRHVSFCSMREGWEKVPASRSFDQSIFPWINYWLGDVLLGPVELMSQNKMALFK
jgi:hypothetical protein